MWLPLTKAADESRYGGKAAQLCRALCSGLNVPHGLALDHETVRVMGMSRRPCNSELEGVLSELGGLLAVRSSAVGEDSAQASFAGQHATVLGVTSAEALSAAIDEVLASASTPAALAYRQKLGLDPEPRMGIVLQKLVRADVAGVLFTRNPVNHADERVVEAAFGLGEAVVQGLVTPDHFRMQRGGRVLTRTAGDKDIAIRWSARGGTEEVRLEPEQAAKLTLTDTMLVKLDELATRCEQVFGGTQDIEFAFEQDTLYLLQRRAITRG